MLAHRLKTPVSRPTRKRRQPSRPIATGSPFLFQPIEASTGGALLATATLAKLAITGRPLGISGVVRGAVGGIFQGHVETWRIAFIVGIALGTLIAAGQLSLAFEAAPGEASQARFLISGACIGLGSALGHGLFGNARLSKRSLAFTAIMLVSGAASSIIFRTPATLGLADKGIAQLALPARPELVIASLVASVTGTLLLGVMAARRKSLRGLASTTCEVVSGAVFAIGLALSGMTRPSKVASFLALGRPVWDPSLAVVMGSALVILAPSLRAVLQWNSPLAGGEFRLPSLRASVDWRLVTGAAIFGVGWGLSGLCPGPALVNFLAGSSPATILPFIMAMVLSYIGFEMATGRASPAPSADGVRM